MKKKTIYKRAFIFLRNIIILRTFRRKLKLLILKKEFKKQIAKIELQFDGKIVYIFQHQFYDMDGEKCYNGGAERYCMDLANLLSKNNYLPVLVQMGSTKKGWWQKRIGDLIILGVPVDSNSTYQAILQLYKKYEFVIYSGAVEWGKKLHPNILISHGITWDAPNKDFKLKNILKIFHDVDEIVSVDTNTLSWLRTTFPFNFQKTRMNYIPNYVDTTIYKPKAKVQKDTIQITFPRRASPERGYWLMSEALPPIMKKYPSVVFDFVGFNHGDKITADIQKLLKQFPGRIQHYVCEPHEMCEIYQKTDISLMPTLYAEGTSLSCLEAQACGNVVISTNIGGLPNLIIDGYNGLLINPLGFELMNALDKVISNKTLQMNLSSNAVKVAEAFDKKIWENRWGELLKRRDVDG